MNSRSGSALAMGARFRDHIIPRAIVPELDNVIASLELMPLRMNESKNDHIGDRQRDLAKKFYKARLLSKQGLDAALR